MTRNFICECNDRRCRATVRLTPSEYDSYARRGITILHKKHLPFIKGRVVALGVEWFGVR